MNEETLTDLDAALARFKALRVQPKSVKVTLGSGEVRTVPLEATRQKWQALRKVLGALDWLRVEAMSARDELLAAYEADGEYEEDDADPMDARLYATVCKLVRLNMDTQRDALKAQGEQAKALLDGAASCVRVMSESVHALQKLYEQRLKIAEALAAADTDDGDGLASSKWVELLMPALLPKIVAAMGGKPNGA